MQAAHVLTVSRAGKGGEERTSFIQGDGSGAQPGDVSSDARSWQRGGPRRGLVSERTQLLNNNPNPKPAGTGSRCGEMASTPYLSRYRPSVTGEQAVCHDQ